MKKIKYNLKNSEFPFYKVELHRHLDCSMRFSTMLEIAKEIGMILPKSRQEQRELMLLTKPLKNLALVLNKFQIAQQLLYSESVLERVAFETVVESYQEGTRILELRYSPTFIQHAHPHFKWEAIHHAFLRGIHRAQSTHEIAIGLIIIIQRTLSPDLAESIVDFAITHKNTIVGIDLADNEDGFNALPFKNAFKRAKSSGLHITIHAGEIPTRQSIKNIEEAIELLGAERIGHGIQAIHSKEILKLIKKRKVLLEICPTSNYLTQGIKKLTEHPLRALYNEGILLNISTDDPGIFNYTLTDELKVCRDTLGFSIEELSSIQKMGWKYSFITSYQKNNLKNLYKINLK